MRLILTTILAVVLAGFASFGIYQAAQPTAKQVTTPLVNYGSR
jgi:hypothetical protein